MAKQIKIRMRTKIAGPTINAEAGAEIMTDEAMAKALINGKYAEAVEFIPAPKKQAPKKETATAPKAPETAADLGTKASGGIKE